MKEQRRVYEALAQARKEELSSEKVELSVVADIDRIVNEITQVAQDAANVRTAVARIFNDSKKATQDARKAKSNAEKVISEAERAAKDLGVSPDSVGKLSTLRKRLNLLENIEEYHNKLMKAI